jgi:hypothetical protein
MTLRTFPVGFLSEALSLLCNEQTKWSISAGSGPDYEILGRYALLENGPNSAEYWDVWVECLYAFFS